MESIRRIKSNTLKRILTGLALLIIVTATITLALRNVILKKVINNRLYSLEHRTDLNINYSDAYFSGISTVNIEGLLVTPPDNDTLLTIDSISVGLKAIDLILNKLRFTELHIKGTLLSLNRNEDSSNYLIFFNKSVDTTKPDTVKRNDSNYDYAARVEYIMKALFNHIPSKTEIIDFKVSANLDSNYFQLLMPVLKVEDTFFNTDIEVSEDNTTSIWNVKGQLNSKSRNLKFSVKTENGKKVTIPYIDKRWDAVFAFDSASLDFNYTKEVGDISRLKGKALLSGPLLNHPRISPDDVQLRQSEINYTVNIGKSFIELDSSSYISFNETGFNPYVLYVMQPHKRLSLQINEQAFDAQQFFNSLPGGLFSNLEGIRVRGDLNFYLNFQIAFNQPDSLIFESRLRGKGFVVERFGNTNFTFINEPFVYTVYERGQPVRSILVGEGNPDFRSLSEIPDHLKHAIMTSEDGQFYYHNGFIPDAIRHSIITNIKEKRFARGGSTISMQLVKNVFLNRNKNITRKLEEMLITWLIESKQMVTKDRMLEVYLNIIETGPMTYGVSEAARFYFKKDVSKLTLAESIYIASIVPRPKLFKYSFDKQGNLREYLSSYYTLVSGKMLNRGWITQEEFDNLRPEIKLTGPARHYIITDSIPPADEIIKDRRRFFDFFKFDFLKKRGN